MRKTLMTLIAALAAADLWAIQGTIKTTTQTLTGDIKWQGRSKLYVVHAKKGKTEVDLECKLADVERIDVPEPAALAKAIAQVESGQGLAAIGALTKIVADYKMLNWDRPAGRYLAQAYVMTGQAQKAYDVCTAIIADDKTAAYSGDLAAAYWQALLKLGKREQLEGLVKKAASSGSRQASAAALVMRADIILSGSSDSADKLREALTKGYLRVVLMYQDAECARERQEACLKAATCFDKLGQTARAENLRAQAKTL